MSIAHLERSRVHSNLITCSIIVVAFVLLLSPLLAAQTFPETSDRQIPRIRVTGRVINSVTGEPISRALVMIEGRAVRNTFTDSEGNFAFDDVVAVPLVFYARKVGFVETAAQARSIVSPKEGENITLKLNPFGLIFGQVTNDDGEPIESTSIQAWTQRIFEGRKQWTPVQNTNTDEDGRFRIAGLSPGKYLVSAGPFNQRELGQEPRGFPSTYYPNATDRNSATPIQVGIGQQVEANFSLNPVPVFALMGTVLGQLNQSMGLTIRDSAGQDVGMGAAFNRTTGQFRFVGIPRGTYTISANSYGPSEDSMTGRATVTITASRDGIVIPLHPAIKVPVEVHRENVQRSAPQPQPGQPRMTFEYRTSSEADVQVRAIRLNGDARENFDFAMRDQQGRIVLQHLEPGSYRIVVMALGDYYVQSVNSGGVDLLSEPLVISDSGTANPIEVVIRNDTAKLKATVRGNDGYGAVIAIPLRSDFQPPMIGSYGGNGECYFPPLAPGTYRLYAFDRGAEEIEYANREAMEPYDSKSVQVTLTSSQMTEATVDVIKVAQ